MRATDVVRTPREEGQEVTRSTGVVDVVQVVRMLFTD